MPEPRLMFIPLGKPVFQQGIIKDLTAARETKGTREAAGHHYKYLFDIKATS